MSQLSLGGMEGLEKAVNVSSVPQRSPFRYPGGKTWLIPRVRQWLRYAQPKELVEPFAGGGIVSLTAAAEGLAGHITMVELDEQVAAVWHTILGKDRQWLIKKIGDFEVTLETVTDELARNTRSTRQKAFQTILKNRTFHGGILAAGSAPLKYGEAGKGITSRWYPATLQRRISEIGETADRITFIEGDGLEVMRETLDNPDYAYFIDPPYTAAGKKAGRRLYTHSQLDHEELFRLAGKVQGDVLLTYDDADGVRDLAAEQDFDLELIAMQNTHLAKMTELLIGKDLSWVR